MGMWNKTYILAASFVAGDKKAPKFVKVNLTGLMSTQKTTKRFYYTKLSLSDSERDRLELKFKAGRGSFLKALWDFCC
jgi:hypothetical protein